MAGMGVPARGDVPGWSKTASGVESYDVALWSSWTPQVDVLFRDVAGLTLLQLRVPETCRGETEAVVAHGPANAIILFPQGTDAEFECSIDGRRLAARPTRWNGVFCPSSAPSWWRLNRRNHDGVVHLHLDQALMEAAAEQSGLPLGAARLAACNLSDPLIEQTARWLIDDARSLPPSRLLQETAANMLALRLLRCHPASVLSAPQGRARGGLATWQVRQAANYIQDNLAADVGLTALAASVGLSPFHFARAFKQSTGMPPHAYQLRCRLEKAQELLTGTELLVTEIAFAVGYESSQALARLFAREVGTSPSAYRRERRS